MTENTLFHILAEASTIRNNNHQFFSTCTYSPSNNEEDGFKHIPTESGGYMLACPHCHTGHLMLKRGRNRTYYWICSNAPCCNVTFQDRNGTPYKVKCPNCKDGFLLRKGVHGGKDGYFWCCSEYPNCHTKFPDKECSPDMKKYKEHHKR